MKWPICCIFCQPAKCQLYRKRLQYLYLTLCILFILYFQKEEKHKCKIGFLNNLIIFSLYNPIKLKIKSKAKKKTKMLNTVITCHQFLHLLRLFLILFLLYKEAFYFYYYVIDTKYPPRLASTNL